jgi:hypothetical protein
MPSLDPDELAQLLPETTAFPSPIPTQFVSSDALYRYDRPAELTTDRIAVATAVSEREGLGRTNRRYGYVTRSTV